MQRFLIHVELERQRGKGEEHGEPDTVEGDDLDAAIWFVGEVCARAATFGEGVGDERWRPAVKTGGGAVQ